jgi:uncharacterized low-complexity protein
MFSTWAKLALASILSLALVAAPCKHCQPKTQQNRPQDCGHDCCPKPKPAQTACSWQPADYDAVENAKATSAAAPALSALPEAPVEPAPATSGVEGARPDADPSPPPGFLATFSLRL